jgi:hypothetical protein
VLAEFEAFLDVLRQDANGEPIVTEQLTQRADQICR